MPIPFVEKKNVNFRTPPLHVVIRLPSILLQACSRALSVRISSTSNDSSSSKEVIATAPDPDGFIVVAGNSITDGDQYDPCKANMDSHKADIDPHSSTSPASSCSSGQGSHGRLVDGSSSRNPLLTFREFCFFLLLAPSLVLVPEWVKQASATTFTVEVKRPGACCRRRRIGRAACEFFHAALTYLAVHAMASGMYAPVMRVLATLFCDDASSFWLDAEAWSSYRCWVVLAAGERDRCSSMFYRLRDRFVNTQRYAVSYFEV